MILIVIAALSLMPGHLVAEPAGARADSLYRAALALKDDGNRELAVEALRRVIAEDPRRTMAYSHLGHLLVDAGDMDGAEQAFNRALDLDDRCVEGYYGLGRVFRRRNKERLKAIQFFRSALARNPGHIDALYELAMTQLELDDYDAKSSFEDLVRLDPQHPDGFYELGRWFEKSRRHEEAAREYERQIRVNPGHPLAQRALRNVYSKIRSARRLGDLEIVFDLPGAGTADGNARDALPTISPGRKVSVTYRVYFCGVVRPRTTFRVEAFLDEDTKRGPGRTIVSAFGRMVGRRWDVFLIPFELAGLPAVQTGSVEVDGAGVKPGNRRLVIRVVDDRNGAVVERDRVVVVR